MIYSPPLIVNSSLNFKVMIEVSQSGKWQDDLVFQYLPKKRIKIQKQFDGSYCGSRHRGISHKISLEEAENIYEKGAEQLIIGTGQYNQVKLSNKAIAFFRENGCAVQLLPTPKAAKAWNEAKGAVIAMFHVTC